MTATDYVRCTARGKTCFGVEYGQSKKLLLGVVYFPDGTVELTISGYPGQEGKPAFLSNQPGDEAESLAVHTDTKNEELKQNCRFVIENC